MAESSVPTDAEVLRRQAGAAWQAMLRPGTYVGAAREAAMSMFHVAAHPWGASGVDLLQSRLRADRAVEVIPADAAGQTARMPVILVHGYVMNRSAFMAMSQALHKAGFRHVDAFNYPQFTHGIPELGRMLASEVQRMLAVAGTPRCMIVGHSMGGVVARHYIQYLGGHDTVDTLVTLGTPHHGTYTASLGTGPAAVQMCHNSVYLRKLNASARPSQVRYISYYSDLDAWVLPAVSARLDTPALQATNIKVRDIGHLSMLLSSEVIASVAGYLSDPAKDRSPAVQAAVRASSNGQT